MSGEFGLGSNIQRASLLTGGDLNLSEDPDAASFVLSHAGPCPVLPNELMDDVLLRGRTGGPSATPARPSERS